MIYFYFFGTTFAFYYSKFLKTFIREDFSKLTLQGGKFVDKKKLLIIGLVFVFSMVFYFLSSIAHAENIAFDTFEYWDSPLNHGWQTSDPPYPVFGYQVGFGGVETLVDFAEGSRVLQTNGQASVFNQLEPYTLFNYNLIDSETENFVDKKVISFKMRAPFAIEYFDMFRFCVVVTTTDDETKTLVYRPVKGPEPTEKGDIIEVCIGRQYQDGTWHLIVRNMDDDIAAAIPGIGLKEVKGIIIKGNNYRLDEIFFHDDMSFMMNHPPELWRIGPQFATLFTPFQYLLAARDPDGDFLHFIVNIGGYGASGSSTQNNFAIRLLEDPNDPNSDIAPDIALIQFIPQVLEDLIVTVRVTDGQLTDVETFPLSVVTYPVAGMNYPPLLEEFRAAVAYVGEEFVYDIEARDPDYGDILTFSATINGLPSYQYGPWSFNIINPITGRISFTPFFGGEYKISVTVRDSRGMYAQDIIPLTVVNPGSWLNHNPVLVEHIQNPQVAKAGNVFLIPLEFIDPDGDELYYSCNIGSLAERTDGKQGAVFSFFTHFPGQYLINITAYDDRGGLTDQSFLLDVQPWWSL